MASDGVRHVCGGRFQLLAPLGSGGFGTVWKAVDTLLGVEVAVKELAGASGAPDADRAARVARAEREARKIASLRGHPHVVLVHDIVVEDGLPWIVMEFVRGRSLADLLEAEGPVTWREAVRVGLAVLSALDAAHGMGIVHRDVKPANILLGTDGRIVLVDFGIAVHDADTTLTHGFVGTLAYTAPERFDGARALPASDLFSLGATLYHAVEGVAPFASVRAVLSDDPPAPNRAGPLLLVLERMLDNDPATRITAADARQWLTAASGAPATTRDNPPPFLPVTHTGTTTAPAPIGHEPNPANGRVKGVEPRPPVEFKEKGALKLFRNTVLLGTASIGSFSLDPILDSGIPWVFVFFLAALILGLGALAAGSAWLVRVTSPRVLTIEDYGLAIGPGVQFAVRWGQVKAAFLEDGALLLTLVDGANPIPDLAERKELPHLDRWRENVVFFKFDHVVEPAHVVEQALRTYAGSRFTQSPRQQKPPRRQNPRT